MGVELECGGTTVTLLQRFEVRSGHERVELPPAAQRVIAFLALHDGMLNRVYVAGKLWTNSSQTGANASLRTILWRLKRMPSPVVAVTATQVSLAPEVVVDFRDAAAIAQRVSTGAPRCDDLEFLGILQIRELLPDWYDDWVVIERERFRQARLHALEALCAAEMRLGRYGKALAAGLSAVAHEPLRESAHCAVMRVHLAEGNRIEALRQYEFCRRSLVRLGLEPSHEIERLRLGCSAGMAGRTDAPNGEVTGSAVSS